MRGIQFFVEDNDQFNILKRVEISIRFYYLDTEVERTILESLLSSNVQRYYSTTILEAPLIIFLNIDLQNIKPLQIVYQDLVGTDGFYLQFIFNLEINEEKLGKGSRLMVQLKLSKSLFSILQSKYEGIVETSTENQGCDSKGQENHPFNLKFDFQASQKIIGLEGEIDDNFFIKENFTLSSTEIYPTSTSLFDNFIKKFISNLETLFQDFFNSSIPFQHFNTSNSNLEFPIFSQTYLNLPNSIRSQLIFIELSAFIFFCIINEKPLKRANRPSVSHNFLLNETWEDLISKLLFPIPYWRNIFPYLFEIPSTSSKLKNHTNVSLVALGEKNPQFVFQNYYPNSFDIILNVIDPKKTCQVLTHKAIISQSLYLTGFLDYEPSEINLQSEFCPPAFLLLAIGFMYYNTLPVLSVSQYLKLIRTADYLCFLKLRKMCEKRLSDRFHDFNCSCEKCSKTILNFARAVYKYPECSHLESSYNILINKCEVFWPVPDFAKLPSSMKEQILIKCLSKINQNSVFTYILPFYRLRKKYFGQSQITPRFIFDSSDKIVNRCYEIISNHFVEFIKDEDSLLIDLFLKSNKTQGFLEDLLDSVLSLFSFKQITSIWLASKQYFDNYSMKLEEQEVDDNIGISMDQEYVKDTFKCFLRDLGRHILRNQFRIHIVGGFKCIKSSNLETFLKDITDISSPDKVVQLDQNDKLSPLQFIVKHNFLNQTNSKFSEKPKTNPTRLKRSSKPVLDHSNYRISKSELKLGAKVYLKDPFRTATIKYIGNPQFAPGLWIGIELSKPVGKSDGEIQGIRYFQTLPKHALFVKQDKVFLMRSNPK